MNFLEFHQFVKQDLLIYSWIVQNFYFTKHQLAAGKSLVMEPRKVIVMREGIVLQESLVKQADVYRVFVDQRIIFTTEEKLSLYALETTTYSIIDTNELFEKLEEQQLLANFFLQMAEDIEEELEWKRNLFSSYREERIYMVLMRIIHRYKLDPVNNPEFPRWLKIYILAKLAKCSFTKTSMVLNDLFKNGMINIKVTPWILTGQMSGINEMEHI
ncbi:hypothetical protein C2D64_06120 [Listeria ivanovii]|uniref:Crp/Fnr family transcriptional regulator n=1 Tax=Listeria ivanovii TaxID=1638 RepID=UPI000DA6E726|nr:Crp/Fnr family transcriptional regulator [Listeria ivanovii]PZG33983.1 hypothetical protein C2D64_06120 [Listeria ivanovii]PZG48521.1 hypothetical protein C2D66_05695 [Listeria ivanovii]PZH11726.1 hypothetical protein C2D65_06070 [Listeria ivanovii]